MIKQSQSKNIDLPENHDHNKKEDLIGKNNPYYPTKVAIDNFWDDNIKIKNKLWNNEDFKRYRIKDWNIDNKINQLFSEKKII